MYAKLIYSAANTSTGNTTKSNGNMIRDIVRLCTSSSPNVANLVAFSNTASVIVNSSAAGWSFVYSSADGTTLPAANVDANATSTGPNDYWAMSAPCLGPGANTVKYAKLTTSGYSNTNAGPGSAPQMGFSLTSAASISNTGTVTGEGFRVYTTSTGPSAAILGNGITPSELSANGTYHVIATPRHLTIIKEGSGFHSVWENTVSDYHTFYNIAPVISMMHKGTGRGTTLTNAPSSTAPAVAAAGYANFAHNKCLYNITDVNTGTNYSALQMGRTQSQPYMSTNTDFTNMKTIAANGVARNLVVPIMYQLVMYGIPSCFVTDICDMYWTGGGIGTTGDTLTINGVSYTYFDCSSIGLAINVGPT